MRWPAHIYLCSLGAGMRWPAHIYLCSLGAETSKNDTRNSHEGLEEDQVKTSGAGPRLWSSANSLTKDGPNEETSKTTRALHMKGSRKIRPRPAVHRPRLWSSANSLTKDGPNEETSKTTRALHMKGSRKIRPRDQRCTGLGCGLPQIRFCDFDALTCIS